MAAIIELITAGAKRWLAPSRKRYYVWLTLRAQQSQRAAPRPLQFPAGDLWVFGYGSLMWKPGFPHVEARPARIHGYHRSLCVRSWVYRGTRENPGLVLGLDRGGSCIGRAFRVAESDKRSAVDYLYQRELVTNVYVPKLATVRLDDEREVTMLTFTVDRMHVQYAGRLGVEEAAKIIRHACGKNGPNVDYIRHTVAHLDELGIADSLLHRVQALLCGSP